MSETAQARTLAQEAKNLLVVVEPNRIVHQINDHDMHAAILKLADAVVLLADAVSGKSGPFLGGA